MAANPESSISRRDLWRGLSLGELLARELGGGKALKKLFVLTIGAVTAALLTMSVVAMSNPASGSTSGVHTINLGAGPITVGKGTLSIAFFSAGSTDAYLQSANSAAIAAAKRAGVKLTFFDGNFSPVTETNQLQQALATGHYTGWAVESDNACNIMKHAIKKGILISVFNGPQCKSITAPGVAAWEPGTLNFVAGDETRASFQNWLNKIVSLNPGPQQMLVLEGPSGISQTTFTNEAIAQVEKSDPQMKIITELVPAYTLAGADTATAAVLTANPNLTIVAGNYSDLTLGAVVAIKAAGKMGNINVYDSGGSKQVITEIKAGEIKLTQPYLPATESVDAVESIINAWHGKLGPHYVDIMKSLPGGQQFITKANVNNFRPQY